MNAHQTLQRRVLIGVGVVLLLVLAVAVPLNMNNQLRYDVALNLGLIPGKQAERIANGDSGAQLIVIPLDHGKADGTSPWLYRAQFIAWPSQYGMELENLETEARIQVPLQEIDFTSANADGSLVLLRGTHADTGKPAAFTIAPEAMTVSELPTANSVPSSPGDWETPSWEKTSGMCNRPSPDKRFVACFTRSATSSYLAGDWQLDLQQWGNFEVVHPLYRGMGFLPTVGFTREDRVVYLQNENGIVRIEVPQDILSGSHPGTP